MHWNAWEFSLKFTGVIDANQKLDCINWNDVEDTQLWNQKRNYKSFSEYTDVPNYIERPTKRLLMKESLFPEQQEYVPPPVTPSTYLKEHIELYADLEIRRKGVKKISWRKGKLHQ